MGREGAYWRIVGRFYVALVQAVLLFESETWVMNIRLEKALEGLHQRVVRWMAYMVPKYQQDGTCVYTPIVSMLSRLGLE